MSDSSQPVTGKTEGFLSLFIRRTGNLTQWLTTGLVVIITIDVVLRYLFNQTAAWIPELQWHLFSILFLFGASWTFQEDRHVRVDVFYSRFSERTRHIINLAGHFILLIPFCILVIITSVPFIASSFSLMETSSDPGGLPFRFIIKSAIPLGFFFLLLAAIGDSLRIISTLVKNTRTDQ